MTAVFTRCTTVNSSITFFTKFVIARGYRISIAHPLPVVVRRIATRRIFRRTLEIEPRAIVTAYRINGVGERLRLRLNKLHVVVLAEIFSRCKRQSPIFVAKLVTVRRCLDDSTIARWLRGLPQRFNVTIVFLATVEAPTIKNI